MENKSEESEGKENEMTEGLETTDKSLDEKINNGEGSTKKEQENLLEKINELNNKYLRALADYQNLQKRTSQEKEELYKFAAQRTIETLIPALDTFDYARQTLNSDAKVEKVIEDFKMVFDILSKALKDLGIEFIEEIGIPFDPVYHDPLHQIQNNELPDHTVMQILKKGYILNGKVIRPALVTVSARIKEGQ